MYLYIICMSCLMSCLKNTENIRRTVLLSSHPALHVIFDILKSAHCHIVKSPLLKSVLPKPPRVVFRNPKSLPDKLVRSKLKSEDEKVRGNFPCCRKNCGICNILYPSNQFRSTVTGEVYKTFILIAIVIIIILIPIVIVWFICLHVKFVQSNIQDQLLPS